MTETEIAWIAGLLEGEGSFLTMIVKSHGYMTWRISYGTTDGDVARKYRDLIGFGANMRGPTPPSRKGNAGVKDMYRVNIERRDVIRDVLVAILPHMGERRANRIREMLSEMESQPRRAWRHGTRQGYEHRGCRCDLCRASNARRSQRRRDQVKSSPSISALAA